ncbi:hypothetical protein [Thalassomonas haliotis]|uniref:DUF4878 domain-containing protein n=1 Tax=Thalassomonas haliotis TaxID=485448 RepID=A0ABY7VJD6_9GAMM|nr:hypothetical protein [Thalassomonas haliotis]WDE13834.1 hypothetical protein H3N35_10570 [Thalassomonas haliotis]
MANKMFHTELIKKYLFVFFISILVLGCSKEKQEPSADEVAVAFFDAIYNQKDINQALLLCSERFAKQVKQQRSASQVARRLFNMSFDSVQINAALGDKKLREEFNQQGSLTILFTGLRQEKVYKDLKKIKMIKQGNTWLIDEILADPMPV